MCCYTSGPDVPHIHIHQHNVIHEFPVHNQRGAQLDLCFYLFPLPWAELTLWQQKAVQRKVGPLVLGLVIPRTPA